MYFLLVSPKAAKSVPLQGLVNARSIFVLIVSSQRDRNFEGPIDLNDEPGQQPTLNYTWIYIGGLLLKIPFSMWEISGCFPTSTPSIFS